MQRARHVTVLALSTLLTVTLAASIPVGSGGAATSSTSLYNCSFKSSEPTSIVLTCADANRYVDHIVWSTWGSAVANATGILHWNDCAPSCAAGKFHTSTIAFAARRPLVVRGTTIYTQLVGPNGDWGVKGRVWNLPRRAL
jgi:hypothetical protein